MQKKKIKQSLCMQERKVFGRIRIKRRAITAICLIVTMFPFVPPAENAFAAMVQNIPDSAEEQNAEKMSAATPSDADFIEATPSDAWKKPLPDGFYTDEEEAVYYRKNGEPVKNEWIYEENSWYHTGTDGKLESGWVQVNDIWYFFLTDGKLANGWLYENDTWYYMTENGMLTGYQDIDGNSFYFYEDGSLAVNTGTPDGRMADPDGYLYDPSVVFPSFTYNRNPSGEPGTVSGLSIAGKPVEFYMLSIAGETSGGQLIMGDRGRAYGMCQLDYRYDLTEFIRWAYGKHPELWAEFAPFTGYADGDAALVGNTGLADAFRAAMERSYEGAVTDQLEFMRERYWDSFCNRLNTAGFDLDNRSIAVSAALFSVNVNCGNQPDLFIRSLSPDMTDAEMICKIYDIRNTALADQMVGHVRKGTTGRYRFSEPEMALDLLYGYTTVDTVRSYGYGVEWHGNIFTGSVLTCGIQGRSTDWQEHLATQTQDVGDTEEIVKDTMEEPQTTDNEMAATPSDAASDTVMMIADTSMNNGPTAGPDPTIEHTMSIAEIPTTSEENTIPSNTEPIVPESESRAETISEIQEPEYGPGMPSKTETGE